MSSHDSTLRLTSTSALARQDGLAGNVVYAIGQDEEGALWFGTNHGVTRYRPPAPSPPRAFADAVVADRRYEGSDTVEVPAFVSLVSFESHGMSFKTRPEAMVYRYRLEGHEEEWRNTHSRRVEYQDLPVGEYTFEVRAVDRDLNYSEPAQVRLQVVPDPPGAAGAGADARAGGEEPRPGTGQPADPGSESAQVPVRLAHVPRFAHSDECHPRVHPHLIEKGQRRPRRAPVPESPEHPAQR